MKDINTTDRIIGDSLELYSDIRKIKYDENDWRPKFVRNFIVRRYTNKLIEIINRIRNADKALNKNNLIEFFTFVYNNYPPRGKYNNVSYVKILDRALFVGYEFENVYCRFTLREDAEKFNITISVKNPKSDIYKSFDVNLKGLYTESDNADLKKVIADINSHILNDITDYILDIINSMKGVTGNDV